VGSSYSSVKEWPKVEETVAAETTMWRAVWGQGTMWDGGGGRQEAEGGGWKYEEYLP
jgi:hypothetical protein